MIEWNNDSNNGTPAGTIGYIVIKDNSKWTINIINDIAVEVGVSKNVVLIIFQSILLNGNFAWE